ncbi:MAG: hypothetical protein LBV04_00850 [Deferribacteraceae bacterium]|jgi:hypothetical protein|nr:hypothetical protein [Deferribacteraceae bacterium]
MINFDCINYDHIVAEELPTEAMQAIAGSCGVKTALLLIENLGGRAITIPVKKHTELYEEIAAICGVEAADKLFKTFAGETICIPIRSTVLKYIIRQLAIDNKMLAWLTYTYCINKSTVYSLIKRAKH